MKELIRRYKIRKLTKQPLSDELLVIPFIQNILDNMVEKDLESNPDRIFYFIEGIPSLGDGWYFALLKNPQKRKNGVLWCNYNLLWIVLENKYQLNYNDTQELIKSMLSQHLKCEIGAPWRSKTTLTGALS